MCIRSLPAEVCLTSLSVSRFSQSLCGEGLGEIVSPDHSVPRPHVIGGFHVGLSTRELPRGEQASLLKRSSSCFEWLPGAFDEVGSHPSVFNFSACRLRFLPHT